MKNATEHVPVAIVDAETPMTVIDMTGGITRTLTTAQATVIVLALHVRNHEKIPRSFGHSRQYESLEGRYHHRMSHFAVKRALKAQSVLRQRSRSRTSSPPVLLTSLAIPCNDY